MRGISNVKNHKGFTLVELMIALALVGMIMIITTMAFVYTYGAVIVDQTRAEMVQSSQLFLRKMSEDIRLSNSVRPTNTLSNAYNASGEWVTSDPANVLIITQPASDEVENLIFNEDTGFPYQHEIIYFSDDAKMYRRTITNEEAPGSVQKNTCPAGFSSCSVDRELVNNLENLLFQFYDIDDAPTSNPALARSIDVTVNLKRQVFGNEVTSSNTIRITLRNE